MYISGLSGWRHINNMPRQIINVAMPRSGTKSMAWFLLHDIKLKNCHHEKVPKLISFQYQFKPYDLVNVPKWVTKFCDRNVHWHIFEDDYYFDSNWEKSYYMYAMEQSMPFLRFTIMVRNPCDVANSLRNCFYNSKWRKDSRVYKANLEYYVKQWQVVYKFIYEQAKLMKHKPFVYDFNKYTNGDYNELILNMFDANTEKNRKLFTNHVKKKINNWGKYEKEEISTELYDECNEIKEELIGLCENNWAREEGLWASTQ